MQSKMNSGKSTQLNGNINTENHGAMLIARIDGGPQTPLLNREKYAQALNTGHIGDLPTNKSGR